MSHRLSRLAIAVTLVALMLALVGCSSAIKNAVGDKGSVDVTVKDANTKNPIQGATVTCAGKTETTDEGGEAWFEDLPLKHQEVTVTKEGYQDQTQTANLGLTKPNVKLTFKLEPNP
jgi:hypothetical protein